MVLLFLLSEAHGLGRSAVMFLDRHSVGHFAGNGRVVHVSGLKGSAPSVPQVRDAAALLARNRQWGATVRPRENATPFAFRANTLGVDCGPWMLP